MLAFSGLWLREDVQSGSVSRMQLAFGKIAKEKSFKTLPCCGKIEKRRARGRETKKTSNTLLLDLSQSSSFCVLMSWSGNISVDFASS